MTTNYQPLDTLKDKGFYLMQSEYEKWQIILEARDYLHAYLHDPDSRIYDDGKVIHFDASEWGSITNGECNVCLAGLWYLRKENVLLGDIVNKVVTPQIAKFLDDLRYLNSIPSKAKRLRDWVGIDIPDNLDTELAMKATGNDHWDEDNPNHILAFLNWLLEHRPAYSLQPNEST
ncbi:hypothetical protein [Microcoleus phage My-WqHQDG]|nr:hypothetical protein [Microcoleus phage My-WqHQDG]